MKDERFTATYYVEDGYLDEDSPQTFPIHASEIEEDMDDSALRDMYFDLMEVDFQNKTYPTPDVRALVKFMEWARGVIDSRGKGDLQP